MSQTPGDATVVSPADPRRRAHEAIRRRPPPRRARPRPAASGRPSPASSRPLRRRAGAPPSRGARRGRRPTAERPASRPRPVVDGAVVQQLGDPVRHSQRRGVPGRTRRRRARRGRGRRPTAPKAVASLSGVPPPMTAPGASMSAPASSSAATASTSSLLAAQCKRRLRVLTEEGRVRRRRRPGRAPPRWRPRSGGDRASRWPRAAGSAHRVPGRGPGTSRGSSASARASAVTSPERTARTAASTAGRGTGRRHPCPDRARRATPAESRWRDGIRAPSVGGPRGEPRRPTDDV